MKEVRLYSDGSSRGNPGPGGYGTVLKYTDAEGKEHVREYSGGYAVTTNNRMELLGCIVGFEHLKVPCKVTVCSDSQYLCKAFNEHWIDGWLRTDFKGKKNVTLWKRLLSAMMGHEVTFQWVKGHNGHPENERCDQLATAAADQDNLPEDDLGDMDFLKDNE